MDSPHSLNLNLRGLGASATVAINERSNELIAAGRTIYKLGLGQSPFPVPRPVVQALRDHAHEKDYLPVRGLRPLREAVAAYHTRREDDVERTGDDVLIGPGSKELMFLLQLSYYGELVIPAPSWVSYAPQAQIIGRRVQHVRADREDGWRLTADRLDAMCKPDADRPRILILNYPNNPTGGTYSVPELEALASVAREHGVVLLSDEIYGEVRHDGQHVSIARFYPEGTIISGGLSKWCGAGGWRLGTFLFPPKLRWLLDAMATAASETYTSTSAPIQYAGISAYQDDPELAEYLRRSRLVLGALGTWVADALRAAGMHCEAPAGGFYLFPDASDHRERLAARGIADSATLCERLLEETGVAILPGRDFGRPEDELTMRIAYVDFDGEAALAAVGEVGDAAAVDEAWLRQHCGRVLTAIERLRDWLQS